MKSLPLTILFSLALAGCVSAPVSPTAITDQDIEQYKFGMDRGCRDAGARRGDPRTDSLCGCMLDVFNRSLSKAEWQQAMYYSQRRQDTEEMRVLAPYMPLVESCRNQPSPKPVSPTTQAKPKPPIIGSWEWTRKTNNCTEVYSFKANGTAFVVSGEEKTENTYALSEALESSGRYKLTMTTTKDLGGRDCGYSSEDSTGKTSNIYLLFSPDGHMLAMCESELGTACFGPLRKKAE
jgi:hypothetical protein